jgi:hypothetical protein
MPEKLPVVETIRLTCARMYPNTYLMMIKGSEFNFPYGLCPFEFHRTNTAIPFHNNNNNNDGTRLHTKESAEYKRRQKLQS